MRPPACDRHQSPVFKAYGSADGLMDFGFLYITLLGAHRDVFGWCSCLDELRIALGGCIVTMWVPLVRPSPQLVVLIVSRLQGIGGYGRLMSLHGDSFGAVCGLS